MRVEDNSASNKVELDYCGPATFTVGGQEISMNVKLRGFFQPIDGTYRWHGRTSSNTPALAKLVGARSDGVIRTRYGSAATILDEVDLWGRYRMRGAGLPPFPLTSST